MDIIITVQFSTSDSSSHHLPEIFTNRRYIKQYLPLLLLYDEGIGRYTSLLVICKLPPVPQFLYWTSFERDTVYGSVTLSLYSICMPASGAVPFGFSGALRSGDRITICACRIQTVHAARVLYPLARPAPPTLQRFTGWIPANVAIVDEESLPGIWRRGALWMALPAARSVA